MGEYHYDFMQFLSVTLATIFNFPLSEHKRTSILKRLRLNLTIQIAVVI